MKIQISMLSGLAALLVLSMPAVAVELHYPQADLHGFPSMSDEKGNLIADGELTQKREGDHLMVHVVWRFKDGRVAVEDDVLLTRPELSQESFGGWNTARRRSCAGPRWTFAPARRASRVSRTAR